MPASSVYSLMQTLVQQHGVRDVTFYDDEFTLDGKRVVTLCNLLTAAPLDLTWTCEARVTSLALEGWQLMKAAGCRLVFFGIESGDQGILDTLRKGFTLDDVRRAVATVQSAGIKAAAYFMLGCPGETVQSIYRTLDFAEEIGLDHAQFSVCAPLPGSALWEQYADKDDPTAGLYLGDGMYPLLVPADMAHEVMSAVSEGNRRWAREE